MSSGKLAIMQEIKHPFGSLTRFQPAISINLFLLVGQNCQKLQESGLLCIALVS